MPMPRTIVLALVAGSFAAAAGTGVLAEPLDKESCLKLEQERSRLLTREMKAALERGPDWVKDHLDAIEIEKVREFLGVEETIEFRCRPGGVVVPNPMSAGGVPLPDRKPKPPPSAVAKAAPDMPMPDRKPGSSPPAMGDVEPSQTVADSDKEAPSKPEATR
jgi:hypothetical protein